MKSWCYWTFEVTDWNQGHLRSFLFRVFKLWASREQHSQNFIMKWPSTKLFFKRSDSKVSELTMIGPYQLSLTRILWTGPMNFCESFDHFLSKIHKYKVTFLEGAKIFTEKSLLVKYYYFVLVFGRPSHTLQFWYYW